MRPIEDILTDLFAGATLAEEEKACLDGWLEEPQHAEEFEKLELLKKATLAFFVGEETDYTCLWRNVERRSYQRRMVRRVVKYAACLLLPLALSVFVFLNQRKVEVKLAGSSLTDSCAIGSRTGLPALILASGQQIVLDTTDQSLYRMLASDGVVSESQTLKYTGTRSGKHILRVPRGAEYRLVLSDQTVVWVNAGSELEYPVTFEGAERRVRVRGEAYFEVTKDSLHPFVVETGRAVAKVLGTSFNVYDYAGEEADITLAKGKLEVALQADQTIKCLLAPNENVKIGDELTLQRNIDVDEYLGWRKGVISFHKRRLEEVFIKLSRWYDFEYVFTDPALKDFLFTAWFDRNDSFDMIVKRLEQTGRIRTEIKGRQVTVYNVRR